MKKIDKNVRMDNNISFKLNNNIININNGFNKAFTLIELMVAIAILGILAISATSFNFNKISNKEKLASFNNRIISNIENIRNNSLMGKGVGINLIIPSGGWHIDFSNTGSGKMLVSYNTGGLDIGFPEKSINFNNGYYIKSIKCLNISGGIIDSFTGSNLGTGTIFISGNNISGSGSSLCDNSKTKKLEIITGYKNFTGSILINTISGLVENN